ncbi:hypothetical protein MBLNU230_g8478t1 [Neophaeotheca triangularis]
MPQQADLQQCLPAPPGDIAHITSLSFSATNDDQAILAIGRSDGRLSIWSPQETSTRLNTQLQSPISCLAFSPNSVSRPSIRDPTQKAETKDLIVGDEEGTVYFYCIQWPSPSDRDLYDWNGSLTLLARIKCHSQQLCGLAWTITGGHFASGGNDNKIQLFSTYQIAQPALDVRRLRRMSDNTNVATSTSGSSDQANTNGTNSFTTTNNATLPMSIETVTDFTDLAAQHTFELRAACKALAFAPWQPSLLAAGGGSNDRCIHVYHTDSGSPISTIDCLAQVTSILWSPPSCRRRALAATFGFPQPDHSFRVAVFSWPRCETLVRIAWPGEERALFGLAFGRGVVCATSDGSIKFQELWDGEEGDCCGGAAKAMGRVGSPVFDESFDVGGEVR